VLAYTGAVHSHKHPNERFLQFRKLGLSQRAYFAVHRFISVYWCVYCVFLFHIA